MGRSWRKMSSTCDSSFCTPSSASSCAMSCTTSAMQRSHSHLNFQPRASSTRRRRRACSVDSPSCWVTSTQAIVSSSPLWIGRVATSSSSFVPAVKTGRAEGSQEWLSYKGYTVK